ncbi:ENDD1 protein, partial [Ifrita kowaldi]|nr:ENDD1 protein [Ifrita kowaldi]
MLWLLLLQVLVSCLWLGQSEVVKSSASCPKFFYRNTAPDNALEPANPVWICQGYNNSYHFATLYNRTLRIPVYSAYIYQPGPGNRSKSWFIEPQVSVSLTAHHPPSIETQYKISPQQIGQSQAITRDYRKLQGLDRGHLSPSGPQSGNNRKSAAFTLTNIVPQNSTLNKGAWKDYENQTMAQKTQGCATTYVIMGAVPGSSYIADNGVNKHSHLWSAACCQTNTNMKTWTVIAENNKNQVQNLTLAQLEANLTQLYGRGTVSPFHGACPHK